MAASDSVTPELHRIFIRLPHWGWIPVATIALGVVGIGLSVWLPYQREQQLIKTMERSVGDVGTTTEISGPKWLRQLIGDARVREFKVFHRIVGIGLVGSTVTDAETVQLSGLPNLEHILLDDTSVTDAGLAHLRDFQNLEGLSLNGTAVTDVGLVHLSGLTNLRFLNLDRTAVTDAGLAHLRGLRMLEELHLNGTAVTDNGIDGLKRALPDCTIEH